MFGNTTSIKRGGEYMNNQEPVKRYKIMYKRYLLEMLMRSNEELVDLNIETEEEFIKKKCLCE